MAWYHRLHNAFGSALLGLAVAAGSPHMFAVLAANLPRIDEIRLDWSIAAYSLVCALAATLLCGLYPAVRATRRAMPGTPRAGGRTEVSGRSTAHLALVGVQVSLAVALLLGAGLLVRSFHELGRVSPGFDPANERAGAGSLLCRGIRLRPDYANGTSNNCRCSAVLNRVYGHWRKTLSCMANNISVL